MIMTDEAQPDRRRTAVPPAVEKQIDENIKRLYQKHLDDDLPESLKSLIAKLRAQGAGK